MVVVDLDPVRGSEQGKIRPAVIIQNDDGNEHSPITIVAPIISKVYTKVYPTNVFLSSTESGLSKDSTILLNQIRTIDKTRISKKIGSLPLEIMRNVDEAIRSSLDV